MLVILGPPKDPGNMGLAESRRTYRFDKSRDSASLAPVQWLIYCFPHTLTALHDCVKL